MKISLNNGIANTLFNAQVINRKAAGNNPEAQEAQKAQALGRDQVSISPGGRAASQLNLLMKQKENLMERKQSLMDQAVEKGSGSVSEELKTLEEQMEALDAQIAETMAKQSEESLEEKENGKTDEEGKPLTKEAAEQARLSSVTDTSMNLEQARVISSAKDHLEGRINVLESEIASVNGANEGKQAEVSELKGRADSLNGELGEKLGQVAEEIEEKTGAQENGQTESSDSTALSSGNLKDPDDDGRTGSVRDLIEGKKAGSLQDEDTGEDETENRAY